MLFKFRRSQDSPLAFHRYRQCSGQSTDRGKFIMNNMAVFLSKDLPALPCINIEGNKVAHGTGRDKKGSPLARYFCCQILKFVDGWILCIYIITYISEVHCLPHIL